MPINWGYALARGQIIAQRLKRAGLNKKGENLPVLYLPGILGTKLYDRQQRVQTWGDYRGVFFNRPEHAGYEYEDSDVHRARVLANEQLHAFTIVPGLVHTLVTAELKLVLEAALGYREGRDLFFVGHDWRADHRHLALRLDEELSRIAALFGPEQEVILIGQSASNLAVRYWLATTTEENRRRIAKWYAFGPPWRGTYHALSMMMTGYYPASRYFHGFTADDIASYPSAYQLLPSDFSAVDGKGNPLPSFDIYDPECWKAYRMGPYRETGNGVSPVAARTRAALAGNLQSAREFASWVQGADAYQSPVPQVWFLSDNNLAVKTAVYDDNVWHLEAKEIKRCYPDRASSLLEPGDDHLPLSRLLDERCGPVVRDAHHQPWGESFVYVSQARTHRALINHTPNLQCLAFDLAVERLKRQ
ncbi:hypothetical protein SOASR030_34540 [Leminorella grimontii]|uniref:Lecithin:cholesterol acyltransferase n=1 Tax=Leminorella grimontii TaxID=82981 RepID=A0AAV5N987_9GAMM|nr:hypothetical protein [Leminorella grimontii]KFC93363.1 hypothetical protein GLGR_2926 [Leminorella grimontii ATCC 33999 = DSM 5078]GKX57342.1 hypothetical protein SOASR030_34540 [Leminorella grimontii]VFS54851.1 Uncharacterised protein [Leminorella grimontii]